MCRAIGTVGVMIFNSRDLVLLVNFSQKMRGTQTDNFDCTEGFLTIRAWSAA